MDLEKIIALMPGNVYWQDRQGVYQGCNNNAAVLAGLSSPKGIVGKRIFDFAPFEIAQQVYELDQSVMLSGEPKVLEEQGFDEVRLPAVYFTQKIPLKNDEGHVEGLLGISLNITELKKSQDQLRRAKEEAEKANEAKTEFVLNLSHDIRTPLTGMIGMTDYLQGQETDPLKKDCLKEILQAGTKLEGFISKILDQITHREFGAPGQSTVNVSSVIQEVCSLMLPEIRLKKIVLLLDYADSAPKHIISDEFALKKILLNLLSNAIKFTEEGSVFLHVSLEMQAGREFLLIQVVDTGIGIAEDKQSLLFQQFSRINPSYAGKYKGYGLGLWASKKLIDELGGMIQFTSQLGKGSTFKIYLPL